MTLPRGQPPGSCLIEAIPWYESDVTGALSGTNLRGLVNRGWGRRAERDTWNSRRRWAMARLGGPASRHGSLISLFQVALHLPS